VIFTPCCILKKFTLFYFIINYNNRSPQNPTFTFQSVRVGQYIDIQASRLYALGQLMITRPASVLTRKRGHASSRIVKLPIMLRAVFRIQDNDGNVRSANAGGHLTSLVRDGHLGLVTLLWCDGWAVASGVWSCWSLACFSMSVVNNKFPSVL